MLVRTLQSVGSNDVGVIGAKYISVMLTTNKTLQKLNIGLLVIKSRCEQVGGGGHEAYSWFVGSQRRAKLFVCRYGVMKA